MPALFSLCPFITTAISVYIKQPTWSCWDHHSNVTFSGTTTHNRGKPFYITKSNVTFTGLLHIDRNDADWTCTFQAENGSEVNFAGYTSFSDNYGKGGALCMISGSSVTFWGGRTEFTKNRCDYCSTIYAMMSYLNFYGDITLSENVAYRGGGLSLYSGALTIISRSSYINFTGTREVQYMLKTRITTLLNMGGHNVFSCLLMRT